MCSLLFYTAAMPNQDFFKKRIPTRLQSAALHLSVNMCNENAIRWNYELFLLWAINILKWLHVEVQLFEGIRKDSGSILDGFIGIFDWHNSSERTMANRTQQVSTATRLDLK
jgi:hypothetical protein